MNIHSDLSLRVIIDTATLPWVDAPSPGVQRKMLERSGEEVAKATSIVRYAAGARFPLHVHEFGEEIFVLDGIFEDEHGSYGPGTYLKNTPGSAHAPGSTTGCTLFVKLRHLDPDDLESIRIDTRSSGWFPGMVPGLTVLPLSEFESQHTALVRWAAGTQFKPHQHFGGEEIFVLEGVFEDEFASYPAGTWIRSPHMSRHHPFSNQGCLILVKTGHLLQSLPAASNDLSLRLV